MGVSHYLVQLLGLIYTVIAWLLAIISINMLFLTVLYWLLGHRKKRTSLPTIPEQMDWPVVTIQLPIYNEELVAQRLIDTVAEMDYPADKLFIQVLDDSTDSTRQIVVERVEYWKQRGRWITDCHRDRRDEFKAGALKEGLKTAQGEYIAIFDADFVPPQNWLKRAMLPFFEPENDCLGLVQTRWAHINDEYSNLTRAQALSLDWHFGIEQNMRDAFGFLINFNGTAGIWRRKCIEEAGNWSGETLSEDLDLSYRAQLNGWRMQYLGDLAVPAELPTLMIGYKRQQFRWSKGSAQVARRLGKRVLTGDIQTRQKIQGIIHLFNHMANPLMLAIVILTLPLLLLDGKILSRLPLGWLGLIGIAFPLFYATAQYELYGSKALSRWLTRMPLLAMLGVGIAVNNSRAILEGMRNRPNIFERTPKTGANQRHQAQKPILKEHLSLDSSTWLELFLSLYSLIISVVAFHEINPIASLLFAMYACGFLWVGGATIWEAWVVA